MRRKSAKVGGAVAPRNGYRRDHVHRALFLAGASVLALARVVAGIHYPGDVLGGAVIGLVSALLVLRLGSGYFPGLIRLLSRISDPLVAPGWRALDRAKARRRERHVA
jgi:PAP2 superfamily